MVKKKINLEKFLIDYLDSLKGKRNDNVLEILENYEEYDKELELDKKQVDVYTDEQEFEKYEKIAEEKGYKNFNDWAKNVIIGKYVEDYAETNKKPVVMESSKEVETIPENTESFENSTQVSKSGRKPKLIDTENFEKKVNNYYNKLINGNILSYNIDKRRYIVNIAGVRKDRLEDKLQEHKIGYFLTINQHSLHNCDLFEAAMIFYFRDYTRYMRSAFGYREENLSSVSKIIEACKKENCDTYDEFLSNYDLTRDQEKLQKQLTVDLGKEIDKNNFLYPSENSYIYLWMAGKFSVLRKDYLTLYGVNNFDFDEKAVNNLKDKLAYEKIKKEEKYKDRDDEEIFDDDVLNRLSKNELIKW
ncbi:MAG: hypothetical protein ACOCQD_00105 [archaeon]